MCYILPLSLCLARSANREVVLGHVRVQVGDKELAARRQAARRRSVLLSGPLARVVHVVLPLAVDVAARDVLNAMVGYNKIEHDAEKMGESPYSPRTNLALLLGALARGARAAAAADRDDKVIGVVLRAPG
jgi:hypothetical protein